MSTPTGSQDTGRMIAGATPDLETALGAGAALVDLNRLWISRRMLSAPVSPAVLVSGLTVGHPINERPHHDHQRQTGSHR